MKADRDDMPEYLRPEKKKGHWPLLVAIGVVSAVAWVLATTYGKPIVIDLAKIKESIQFDGRPVFEQAQTHMQEPVSQPKGPSYSQQQQQDRATVLENVEVRQQKQVVFNDQNYQPKGAVNVSPFAQPSPRQQEGVKVAGLKAERKKEDICNSLYRQGSIELRECRMRVDLSDRNNSYTGSRRP